MASESLQEERRGEGGGRTEGRRVCARGRRASQKSVHTQVRVWGDPRAPPALTRPSQTHPQAREDLDVILHRAADLRGLGAWSLRFTTTKPSGGLPTPKCLLPHPARQGWEGGGWLVPSARFFRSVVLSLSSPFPVGVRASAVMATERRKLPEAWAAQLCPCWRRTSLPPGGKEPSTP